MLSAAVVELIVTVPVELVIPFKVFMVKELKVDGKVATTGELAVMLILPETVDIAPPLK